MKRNFPHPLRKIVAGFGAAVLSAVGIAAVSPAVPASAQEQSPEAALNWHIKAFGYDKLHAEGFTGEGITIAITEPSINLDSPDLQGANIEYIPLPEDCQIPVERKFYDHGTMVASMLVGQGGEGKIQGIAPDAKLIVFQGQLTSDDKLNGDCPDTAHSVSGRALAADDLGADIISSSFNSMDFTSVAYLAMRDIPFFQGAGNNGVVAYGGEPGTAAITAHDKSRAVPEWSAHGENLSLAAPGVGLVVRPPSTNSLEFQDGTSLASPIAAGTLALGMQKYPDASGHQLMQSLARNTVGGNPDLSKHDSTTGFGVIDPLAFMAADPMQYPDEPPFWKKPDYPTDDPWLGVNDILDGLPAYEGEAKNYRPDAGINPNAIEWIPADKKDLVGTAPDADYWQSHGDFNAPADKSESGNRSEPGNSVNGSQTLIIGIVAGAALLVILIIAVVLMARRKSA